MSKIEEAILAAEYKNGRYKSIDFEALNRIRESAYDNRGHDMASINNNTLARLVGTIDFLAENYQAAQSQSGWVDMEEYKSRGENKAHVVLIPYGVKQVVLVSPNQENNPFQCLRVDVPPSPKEQE